MAHRLTHSFWIRFFLLAVCAFQLGCSDEQPDLVIISIDSLRRDALGCYGNAASNPSPNIDRLASEGLRFRNAMSTTTWTLPAHHAMLRGVSNPLHGFVYDIHPEEIGGESVAKLLKDSGYQTYGVFSGPYLEKYFGFGGADAFDDYQAAYSYRSAYADLAPSSIDPVEWNQALARTEYQSHKSVTSGEVLAKAQRFLNNRDQDRPMFLFAHFFDVHYDYMAPREFRPSDSAYDGPITGMDVIGDTENIRPDMPLNDLERLKDLYYAEVRWVDHIVNRLMQLLSKSSRETIVIIVSDHGDEFFEHGHIGHRKNLYQETLAIPLIMTSTKKTLGQGIFDQQVRIYDVAPTLLDIAGVDIPQWMEGESLLALTKSQDAPSRPFVADLQLPTKTQYAFGDGISKMIGTTYRDADQNEFELFDLLRDPGETHNRIETTDAPLFGRRYNQALGDLESRRSQVPHRAMEEIMEPEWINASLHALGYIVDDPKTRQSLEDILRPAPRYEK